MEKMTKFLQDLGETVPEDYNELFDKVKQLRKSNKATLSKSYEDIQALEARMNRAMATIEEEKEKEQQAIGSVDRRLRIGVLKQQAREASNITSVDRRLRADIENSLRERI